jgi:YVTN family beta-propeller protein
MSLRSTALRALAVSLGVLAAASVLTPDFGTASPTFARPDEPETNSKSNWRGPSALWLSSDGATLLAAGAKSGAISVIDLERRQVVGEIPIGKSLVALAATADGRTLAAVDARSNELLILDRDGRTITIRSRVPMPIQPTSVVVDRNGENCFVASRWSRVISRVDLRAGEVIATIPLGFSPHQSIVLPDAKTLVVTDAFSGMMAMIDIDSNRVLREVNIPGHNMRGLALSSSGRELLVTHMIVTESAPTTRDNVFWGITMTSNMRVIPIAALMDATKNPVREAHTHFFGDPGNASGDPEALAILSDGTAIVCLAGVGELAIGRYYPYGFRRLAVGRRPVALAVSADEKLAYVANSHSDTISVIDIAARAKIDDIALTSGAPGLGSTHDSSPARRNSEALTLVEEGERLFYDAKLSLDGWFSCHSCHTDGHTNGHRADTFGDGSYGAPKTVLTLLGTANTQPWAWNGSKKQLEDQVRDSLRLTMQPKSLPNERSIAALTAYLRSLSPPPVTAWQKADSAVVARGERVFNARGCADCHVPPIYTSAQVHDVGLDDGDGGNHEFNPPSLRGLVHNGPYFHDGRARALEDVFRVHNHRLRTTLADDELDDLIAFLRSL